MQQINLNIPDKDDFHKWFKEAKNEIIQELKKENSKSKNATVTYETRKETAKALRISLVTLSQLTKEGLPSVKLGRRRLYNVEEVARFIEQKYVK